MLPPCLALLLLACLSPVLASAPTARWRPDLRRSHGGSSLRRRQLLEGLGLDKEPPVNSTVVTVTLASDKQ